MNDQLSPKARKLLSRPVEADTTLLLENIVEFKKWKIEALMELWSWDGITASSIVLLSEDCHGLDDDSLIKKIKEDFKSFDDSSYTISRKEDYIYINFGFLIK